MRSYHDSLCPRCGMLTSVDGSFIEERVAREIARQHVCPDGYRQPSGPLKTRLVAGPGERTKLPEERTS